MNDDWRIQVDFVEEGLADSLHDQLDAEELEHDLSREFQDRVIVSRNGTTIFLYAGERGQAEKAQALVEELTRKEGEEVEVSFTRWHPEAEEWRPAGEPLPETAEAQAAEHAARVERLDAQGLRSVHRWKYVLLGATDEDSANELAERIRAEVPPGSKVAVEGTWREAYAERPHSPFSFLGGLAE